MDNRIFPLQQMKEILDLYILPPRNFNKERALPNKLFEFIQTRLAASEATQHLFAEKEGEHFLSLERSVLEE